jgi:Zn-finger nucleic acid-binding protein
MSDKQGVEIDYCPECRGIWLDRGELDKIIERSAQTQGNSSNYSNDHHDKQYNKHDDRHYDQKGHKKQNKMSFLQDIFDFG